jgi:hypothetical protein
MKYEYNPGYAVVSGSVALMSAAPGLLFFQTYKEGRRIARRNTR